MVNKASSRKRPCRICRRWFVPHPRLKERQKTCGRASCKKEWHRKKCAAWNKNNVSYHRANYLQKKLHDALPPRATSSTVQEPRAPAAVLAIDGSHLPGKLIADEIGLNELIILDYAIRYVLGRFHKELRSQRSKALQLTHGHPP